MVDELTVIPAIGQVSLDNFFDFIYGDHSGYAYLAFKTPSTNQQKQQGWDQFFFEWPSQKQQLISKVKEGRQNHEVYYGPSLYTEKKATKEAVRGSYVFWVEFDGKTPDSLDLIPEPSLRIRSSEEGHEHWYWRSENLLLAADLERINRSLTYLLGADVSGWDCTQVLRPPETFNHKRSKQVRVLEVNDTFVSLDDFGEIPEPPELVDIPIPEKIPAVEDVVAKYPFPKPVWVLFREGVPEGKRSDGLMKLGYHLAEMHLTNPEMLSILYNADERWGKFSKRPDQLRRLNEIVIKAKAKHPSSTPTGEPEGIEALGFKSLLLSKIELEWVWEGFLQKAGYMLLTGPSGVGKTQFALNFSADAALGKPFLETKVASPQKIAFFSLEMGAPDLKYFLTKLGMAYSPEEQELLEENLKFIALGEPLYLAEEAVQDLVMGMVEKYQLTGVVFDSLGSVSSDSLSAEVEAKRIMDWNDRFRARTGCFTLYIHHHRKASGDNKKPNKLADVYGSHYFTSRTTTTMSLWDGGQANSLQVSLLKIRLAPRPEPFNIYRDGRLRFTKKVSGITLTSKKESAHEMSETPKDKPKLDLGGKKFNPKKPTTPGGLGM